MRTSLLLCTGLALLFLAPAPANARQDVQAGQEVYDRWCSSCHGVEGDGLGPAAGYMLPRPRDFTRGIYQIRSTPGGELPTDQDLLQIIDKGMPGTAMPGWEEYLSSRDRNALVEYLKTFYPPYVTLPPPDPLAFGGGPRASEERITEGAQVYREVECWQCHGDSGRGEGTSAPTLEDDAGLPIRAPDLTKNWLFNGGGTAEDVYRRLRTGLDGTPMPSFSDLIDAEVITDDELWSLALFVRSLAPDDLPSVREVIRVARTDSGTVPTSLEDERWGDAESFYIPLVGQIIMAPRWFDPAVTSVWAQGIHDGESMALRLVWHDRSASPDPRWGEWQSRILETMEPREGDVPEAGPLPDRLAVQFPLTIPTGMDRPYFLMGDNQNPVSLLQWRSDQSGSVTRARARGMRDIQELSGGEVTAEARWAEGRWELLLRRPLVTGDPENDLQFEEGVSIPIAFFAWDGDHGEAGSRGSVSSWFFIHLEREVPPTVLVAPLFAMLITGGLGMLVVTRAQRRERLGVVKDGEGEEAHEGPN
ncbi:MAG: c-type cytochrome [Gemmatimonadota bacterium]